MHVESEERDKRLTESAQRRQSKYIYISIHTHTHTHTFTHVPIRPIIKATIKPYGCRKNSVINSAPPAIPMNIPARVHVCLYVYACVRVCAYGRERESGICERNECAYVCVNVCMCVYVCTVLPHALIIILRVNRCIRRFCMCAPTHTHNTKTHTETHVTHTRIHKHTHTHTQICDMTQTNTNTHTHIHTQTRTHTHTHTHKHTHTHLYSHPLFAIPFEISSTDGVRCIQMRRQPTRALLQKTRLFIYCV